MKLSFAQTYVDASKLELAVDLSFLNIFIRGKIYETLIDFDILVLRVIVISYPKLLQTNKLIQGNTLHYC